MPLRIVAGLLGLFFLIQGVNWLVDPATAASGVGMPMLDGLARSTQLGDLSGFFLSLGGFAIYGAYRVNPTWLRAAACLVGVVAVTRTIAWAFHDAPFAGLFIAIELISAATFFASASRLATAGGAPD